MTLEELSAQYRQAGDLLRSRLAELRAMESEASGSGGEVASAPSDSGSVADADADERPGMDAGTLLRKGRCRP